VLCPQPIVEVSISKTGSKGTFLRRIILFFRK
jgi:hypothetical protein